MKFQNLKMIFAGAALTVGMGLAANDAGAHTSAVTAERAIAAEKSEQGFSYQNQYKTLRTASYETRVKNRHADDYQRFERLKAVVADPNKGPEDIKAAMENLKLDGFDKGDAKFIYQARQEILGPYFRAATNEADIDRIMNRMHALDAKENESLLVAGLGTAAVAYMGITFMLGLGRKPEEIKNNTTPKP